MKTVLLLISLFALQIIVAGQTKSFTFSSPDKSFSVELPATAKAEKQKKTADDASFDELFGGLKTSEAYLVKLTADESDPSVSVGFLIPLKPLNQKTFVADVNSYMLFFFGDNKHFLKQADVVVNGFSGREFVFEKGSGSGRAVWVNSGKQIYLLSYFVEDGGEPTSEPVNKVFASFKPMK
jgi:hypothetical protein